MEEFRRLVEIEQLRRSLENSLQELHNRQQQSLVAQTAWKKIALPDAQKLELMQQADLFLDGTLVCPRAILLQGAPGTGKPLLAATLAEVLGNRRFFHPTIAELKHPHLGQSAQLVAELWKQVRASKPAVLFLDECESIFGKRGAGETDAVSLELVQTFLSQWNGKEEGVWLIAATNRREMLDDAILSRFGSQMEICLPDEQARAEILENELGALDVHGELPADIRARTVGMSGRDLAMLAAKVVSVAYPGAIEARHFDAAIQSMRVAGNTQVDKEATVRRLLNFGDRYASEDAIRWGGFRAGIIPISRDQFPSLSRIAQLLNYQTTRFGLESGFLADECPLCGNERFGEQDGLHTCHSETCGCVWLLATCASCHSRFPTMRKPRVTSSRDQQSAQESDRTFLQSMLTTEEVSDPRTGAAPQPFFCTSNTHRGPTVICPYCGLCSESSACPRSCIYQRSVSLDASNAHP